MKKLRRFVGDHWQLLLAGACLLAAVGFLLLFRLGSLTGGLSPREAAQLNASSSWHAIATNPLNAPLAVLQWAANTISSHHGQTIARLPSALLGLVSLFCVAYILRCWYGLRTSLFGTVLFGCSAWLLHVSRLATPDVLYLAAVPALLAIHLYWQRRQRAGVALLFVTLILGLCLYVPGVVWLVIFSFVMQPRKVMEALKATRAWWAWSLAALLALLLIVPLVWACWHTPSLMRTWLGLPEHFAAPLTMLKRLADAVIFMVARGPRDATLWLDRLPILDLFTTAMAVAGAIFYIRHFLAPRTRLLLGYFILSAVLFALNGPVGISLVVPLFYILAAGGIGYLLHEWLRVFPRNPLARVLGLTVVALVVALSCFYNLRAYFVAWPHNPATHATFTIRR